ncbi:efflux transporter outer membrane subunit [Comamonas sp.]|uniref:efflux transporter outer membrane subunit n=1 Tax=Comamonas sp. TaxID=34028 RepID=UPI0012D1A042|nr:efflux transporter outer membrane subunit [Comamonas sp.]MPS92715.1 efflux transporter outer membrane subunit [Comamonas sp.]
MRLLGSAALLAALAACSTSVPILQPQAQDRLPGRWPQAWTQQPVSAADHRATRLAWQDVYPDPALQTLIRAALAHNQDLRLALLRVQEAQAAYDIQRAARLPTVGLGSSHARARVPADLNASGRSVVAGDQQVFVGLNSWELDLWGRVQSLSDAALGNYLALEATRHAVQSSLVKQVALNYLALRSLDERLALTRRTIASREESLRIFKRRTEVGATSRYALTQVQTLVHQAQTIGTQLAQQRALQANALQQLTGMDAQRLPLDPSEPFRLKPVPEGLPSDLLTQRPDIVAAEYGLQAARANVAAARAAFLPRIALTGSWGTASAELDGLFKGGSRAWQFAPSISLPIFDGGQRQANLNLQAVRQNMAVVQYEKTIETAMREVLDALSSRTTLEQQLTVLTEQRAALQERARLARLRYDQGASPYLDVLDAERDLLSAEQQLVQGREALLSAQVALHAALGGGYGVPDPGSATPTEPLQP